MSERQRVCRLLSTRFPSCATDNSGEVWPEEGEIVCRLLRGQELIKNRHYIEEEENYAVSWYWAVMAAVGEEAKAAAIARRDLLSGKFGRPCFRRQWDGPVMRLIGREVLKPRNCGGGYTWMVFTERAAAVFEQEGGAHE